MASFFPQIGGGDGGGSSGGSYYYPYFLEGEGIEREVIYMDLPRYLGPNTISKPGDRDGIEGFWYGGGRMLTEAQVRSLKADSARFRTEQDAARGYPGSRRYIDYSHSASLRDSLRLNPDGNNPDGINPEGRYPDGRYPDGREPGGRYPDPREPGGRYPDPREPGGRYPDPREQGGRYPDGRYPDGRYPEGREPGGRYPEGRYPDGRHQESRYPEGRYPEGRYPEPRYPDGRYPGGRETTGRSDHTYPQPLLAGAATVWPGNEAHPAQPQPQPQPEVVKDPRFLYMPPPDGRPWFDTLRGVYLPPFSPPDPAASRTE